jgi:Uma2 family endonuclease
MIVSFTDLSQDAATPRRLPTMYDLPSDDPTEPGLPDEFHSLQPQLLSATLKLSQYPPTEIFTAFDLNLYYDADHPGWYKRPDWFLVVGVPRLYQGKSLRSSYVTWDEKVNPIVVVEFLSPNTAAEDLGRFADVPLPLKQGKPPAKFEVYETILQIPHYIVYTEDTQKIRHFRWVNGRYQEQPIAPHPPQIWIPELDLGLGLWQGGWQYSSQPWLRWCDDQGQWISTEAEAERAAKETERAEKESAQRQIQQGVRNLLKLGLSAQQIAEAMSLPVHEVQAIADAPNV